eukprot:jgi/Botrbrau1/21019/Bobra.0144s0032.1
MEVLQAQRASVMRCVLLLACILGGTARILQSEPDYQDFDYFKLVRQWDPTVCDTLQCGRYPDREDFTIHGLWPQSLTQHEGPNDCEGPDFEISSLKDLIHDLNRYWPSFKASSEKHNTEFWEHEWEKHGRCAAPCLSSERDYFSKALELSRTFDLLSALMEADIEASGDKLYNVGDIAEAIRRKHNALPLLECQVKGEITAVITCISKDFEAIDCPHGHHASSGAELGNFHCSREARLLPLSGSYVATSAAGNATATDE